MIRTAVWQGNTCTGSRAVVGALLSVVAISAALAQIARVSRVTDALAVSKAGALPLTSTQTSTHTSRSRRTLCVGYTHLDSDTGRMGKKLHKDEAVIRWNASSDLCTQVQSVQVDNTVSAPLCRASQTGLVPPAAFKTEKISNNV